MPRVFIQDKGIWVNFPDNWGEDQIKSAVGDIAAGNVDIPPAPPAPPEPSLLSKAITAVKGAVNKMDLGTGEEGLYTGAPIDPDALGGAYDQFKEQTGINPGSDLSVLKDMAGNIRKSAADVAGTLYSGAQVASKAAAAPIVNPMAKIPGPAGEPFRFWRDLQQEHVNQALEMMPESMPEEEKGFIAELFGATAWMLLPARGVLGMTSRQVERIPDTIARPVFKKMLAGMTAGAALGEADPQQTLTNAALFGLMEAAPGMARATGQGAKQAWEKATRQVTETHNLPENIYIDAGKIRSIFQTGEGISAQELDLIKSLGLDAKAYKDAIKNGLHIQIPLTRILTYADRPWYAKLKELFNKEPFMEVRTVGDGKPRVINPGPANVPKAEDISLKGEQPQASEGKAQVPARVPQISKGGDALEPIEEARGHAIGKGEKPHDETPGTDEAPGSSSAVRYVTGGDALGKEYHGYIAAVDEATGKTVGKVDYSYYNGETAVKMIEVAPEHRRKGIATELLNQLQKDSDTPIQVQGDLVTPEGQALQDKFLTRKTSLKMPQVDPQPQGATQVQPGVQSVQPAQAQKPAGFKELMTEKYKDILELDPAETDHPVFDLIDNYTATPEDIDAYLSNIKNPKKKAAAIREVRSVIADHFGDLIETGRYESKPEGQAIEKYMDSLLDATRAHELHPEDAIDKEGNITLSENRRKGIIEEAFKDKPQATEPVLILTGGAPGSGKSSSLKLAGEAVDQFVHADADLIKKKAGYIHRSRDIHEESSTINKHIANIAIENNHPLIYDSLLANYPLVDSMIQKVLSKAGHVRIYFTHVDYITSAARADIRFKKGEDPRKIPPDAILKGYNNTLPNFIELFNKYKDHPSVDFKLFDNNVDGRKADKIFEKTEHGLKIYNENLFDNLMNLAYKKDAGGSYERVKPATQEDLDNAAEEISRRVNGFTGEGVNPARAAGGNAAVTASAAGEGNGRQGPQVQAEQAVNPPETSPKPDKRERTPVDINASPGSAEAAREELGKLQSLINGTSRYKAAIKNSAAQVLGYKNASEAAKRMKFLQGYLSERKGEARKEEPAALTKEHTDEIIRLLSDADIGNPNELFKANGLPEFTAEFPDNLFEKAIDVIKRNSPPPRAWPMGIESTARTEEGTKVTTRLAIYDAEDLITSHDIRFNKNPYYPEELQPRDRSRAASEMQVERILSGLDPELLGDSPKSADGAPIVGPDGVVESGNGRVIALQKGYATNHANIEQYREWLNANAEKYGLNAVDLSRRSHPVLVRIRTSEVDRVKFARESNVSGQAAMSPMERALDDVRIMDESGIFAELAPTVDGNLNTFHNNKIIRDFLAKVAGKSEMGNYIDKDGNLNKLAYDRVRNAVFAAAYGPSNALEVIAESADDEARNLSRGLLYAAPSFARAKTFLKRGAVENVDITPYISKAADRYRAIKESGETLERYLRQDRLFDDIDNTTAEVLNLFEENKRSAAKLGAALRKYAEIWQSLGDPRQEKIFGESHKPGIPEILDRVKQEPKNETSAKSQSTLFDDPAGGIKASEPVGQPYGAARKAPHGAARKAPQDEGSIEAPETKQQVLDATARKTNTVTLSFLGTGALDDLSLKKIAAAIYNLKPVKDMLHHMGIKDKHDGVVIRNRDYIEWHKYLQMPHDIAIQFPEFKKIYDVQRRREIQKAIFDHAYAVRLKPYYDNCTDADRKVIDRVLIRGEQERKVRYEPQELQHRFNMTAAQIEGYTAVRKALNSAGHILRWKMKKMGIDEKTLKDYENSIKGYVPHKWYGNWAVLAEDDTGEVLFMTKTNFTDRFKERDRIKALFPGKKVLVMESKKIPYGAFQQAPAFAVRKMIDMITEKAEANPDIKDAMQTALSDLYKSKGFGMHFIMRKGTPGYVEDLARPIAEYFAGFTGYTTKMDAVQAFYENIAYVSPKKTPGLYKYTTDYINYVTGDQYEFGPAKQLAYVYYLYGNIKSAAMNLTQNLLLGWPVLSKNTSWALPKMVQAMARATNPWTLSKGEKQFVAEMEKKGYLDPRMTTEMRGFGSNPIFNLIPGSVKKGAELLDVFQHMEQWNRRAMCVALYDSGIRDLDKAAELIEESHFRYSKGNRPELMRGHISPLMTFRSWFINYLTWLKNEVKSGRKAPAMKSLAALVTAGGLAALPFWNQIKSVWVKVMGEDPDTAARRALGQWWGQLLMRGAPSKLGVSFSGSVGMGDILPTDLASLGGVFADVPARADRVARDLWSGDTLRAFEDAAPEVVRNPMAAARMYNKGVFTRGGQPVIDPATGEQIRLTPGEAAKKAVGFQPSRVAEQYDLQETMDTIKQARDSMKQKWIDRYVISSRNGNTEEVKAIEQEIKAYNEKMKAAGREEDMITRSEIITGILARKKASNLPPKYLRPKLKKLLESRGEYLAP